MGPTEPVELDGTENKKGGPEDEKEGLSEDSQMFHSALE
jgi:hypothetical protein